jgi:translocation and assembly module TamB
MRRAVSRFFKWLGLLIASSALLVAILVTGIWVWSGSEGSLEWVLERIARSQPITAEGVRGSLRSGLRVQRLAWNVDGLTVEAFDVRMEWQPTALATRTIQLNDLQVARVRVTDRRPASTDPLRAPDSIVLPYRVVATHFEVDRIEWVGPTQWEAENLAGSYAFDGLGHQLKLDGLDVMGGRYQGQASVGVLGDKAVKAEVKGTLTTAVPKSGVELPMTLEGTVSGPLAQLDARVIARVIEGGGAAASDMPHATATARITPFAAQPLVQAHAQLRRVDLAGLWPDAPETVLSGEVAVEPDGPERWRWRAALDNAKPKPWDEGGLPVAQAKGNGQWRGAAVLVQALQAKLGGGELEATGEWQAAQDWTVKGTVRGVDPAALHTRLAARPLGGTVTLKQAEQALAFDVDLRGDASGSAPKAARARVPAKGRKLDPVELRRLVAQGRWANGEAVLPQLEVRLADASLTGNLRAHPERRSGSGRLQLEAPGLAARFDGELAERTGRGTLQADARDLTQATRWLQRLPFVGERMPDAVLSGRADANLQWTGGWLDPSIRARIAAPSLALAGPAADPAVEGWAAQNVLLTADGRLADAQLKLAGQAQRGPRRVTLDVAGRGGRSGVGNSAVWRAQLPQAALTFTDTSIQAGAWRMQLTQPIDARWTVAASRLDVAPGAATLVAPAGPAAPASQAALSWDAVRWGGGELQTAGRLTGLPMSWIELVGGPQLAGSALAGDLVFDAQWDARLGDNPRVNATLARRQGDVTVLAETVEGGSTRVPAGVREARITLAGQGEQLTLTARWDSERAGQADAQLVTSLSRGGPAGWQWAETAPVRGTLKARLPRIGVWSLLAPPGWRLRGSLAADVSVSGTRSQPQLAGTLNADELALRSVVEGVELRNGRLRARLDGERLRVDEFVLHGAGEGADDGTLSARGEGAWTANGLQLQAEARLTKLRASIRSDRDLTVSGDLSARLDAQGADVKGQLKVDRANIELPEELPPRLGDDVVVRQAAGKMATSEERKQREPDKPAAKRPFNVAVQVDLGPEFRLRGRGLDTRLRGELAITGQSLTQPRLNGVVQTYGGEYRAYGQWLDIERGVLRFTGPLDNPSLDILALRPNLTQRVGVMISGNVQSPFVRLYAEPDMPDAEKLNWLVLGRAAPAGGGEAALVQQAALTLLTQRRGGTGGGLASRVGLDELGVRRDSTEGAVITLGKRFAKNFYASYERSLSGALGTLYIFYDISRRVTLRAEAGERAAVDLIFTFSFDRIKR